MRRRETKSTTYWTEIIENTRYLIPTKYIPEQATFSAALLTHSHHMGNDLRAIVLPHLAEHCWIDCSGR